MDSYILEVTLELGASSSTKPVMDAGHELEVPRNAQRNMPVATSASFDNESMNVFHKVFDTIVSEIKSNLQTC